MSFQIPPRASSARLLCVGGSAAAAITNFGEAAESKRSGALLDARLREPGHVGTGPRRCDPLRLKQHGTSPHLFLSPPGRIATFDRRPAPPRMRLIGG